MANVFGTTMFVILKMIVEIIVMKQDHMVLYVVCWNIFFFVTITCSEPTISILTFNGKLLPFKFINQETQLPKTFVPVVCETGFLREQSLKN